MRKKLPIKNPKSKPETTDRETSDKKRLTVDIPMELHMKLKLMAVKSNKTMAEIICNLLEEGLK